MSNLERWKSIMDFYYMDLNASFLEWDLRQAGFPINRSDSPEIYDYPEQQHTDVTLL